MTASENNPCRCRRRRKPLAGGGSVTSSHGISSPLSRSISFPFFNEDISAIVSLCSADLALYDIPVSHLLAEEEAVGFYTVPERKAKHLHVLIAQDQLQGTSAERMNYELVGKVDIEISQMAVQQSPLSGQEHKCSAVSFCPSGYRLTAADTVRKNDLREDG